MNLRHRARQNLPPDMRKGEKSQQELIKNMTPQCLTLQLEILRSVGMKTVNISRFLLTPSEAVSVNDELLWPQIHVCKVIKTSKFKTIKTPTAAVLPLPALCHILDIPMQFCPYQHCVTYWIYQCSSAPTSTVSHTGYTTIKPRFRHREC